MDQDTLLKYVNQELKDSIGGDDNGFAQANRRDSLAYYLGNPDGRESEGKSHVISTDVADAIEWIKPQVIEQLTKNDEIVVFDPISAEDETQADLETKIVHDIVMKDNEGFVVIHELVFDALLQKNGILKISYDNSTVENTERYTGLNQMAYQILVSDPSVEIKQQSFNEDQTIDVKILRSRPDPRINISSIPPEEFRINRTHNSCNPATARFCAHVVLKTASELLKMGFDPDIVDELQTASSADMTRDYRFYMQGETAQPFSVEAADPSERKIEVSECVMWTDIDGDGKSELCTVTAAGGSRSSPTHILKVEEIDEIDHPFVSALAIMMSHKFLGLSIYDRLKQIQDQKTALWRNNLDNLYLQNNQRLAVTENMVNLDDLMVSRPGGIVRQKVPGSIQPIITPQIGEDAYRMMDYLDQVRAGRVGVTPEGQIQVDNIGDRVGSQGVERLMTAKEAVVGLIIRVIAETGIKPAYVKIQNLARKHFDAVREFKYKDEWVQTIPSGWPQRSRASVRVGTGSGSSQATLMAMDKIIQSQMAYLSSPKAHLVTDENIFSAWKGFCNAAGMSNVDSFFLDPSSQRGQAVAQQQSQAAQMAQEKEDQMNQAMVGMQTKLADAEVAKAQAQMENVQLKAMVESTKNEIAQAKATIENTEKNNELQFKYTELIKTLEYKVFELEQKLDLERDKLKNVEQPRKD